MHNLNKVILSFLKLVDSFEDISFLYINNRKDLDTKSLINLYLPKIKETGFIGGNGPINFKPSITFEDGSWLIKKEDYEL